MLNQSSFSPACQPASVAGMMALAQLGGAKIVRRKDLKFAAKPPGAKRRVVVVPEFDGPLVEPIRMVEVLAPVPTAKETTAGATQMMLRGPTVERGSWDDPTDLSHMDAEGNPVRPRQITGFRRAQPLRTLSRRAGSPITEDYILAGDLFEGDFEDSQKGHFASGPAPEIRGSSGPGDYDTPQQMGRIRFEAACKAIGRMGTDCLGHVVLTGGDVSSWAEKKKIDRKFAMGVLVMVLDRLVEHYGVRMQNGSRASKAAGTSRPSSGKRAVKV